MTEITNEGIGSIDKQLKLSILTPPFLTGSDSSSLFVWNFDHCKIVICL